MKIFISQPMRGKTREQILSERAGVVHAIEDRGDTVADTVITETPPAKNDAALYFLGAALKVMSNCDAVFFMPGWEAARGCKIEFAAATLYGLKILTSLEGE